MTTDSRSLARAARSHVGPVLLAKQIGLALIVFLLSVLWLQLPDASAFNVVSTIVLGLIVLVVATAGESWIALGVAGKPATRKALLRGAVIILAALALWFGWSSLIDHWRMNDSLRAGYFNSRFPHSLRNLFSYRHIVLWLGFFWNMLQWVVTGVIAVVAFSLITARRPLHSVARIIFSITFWLSLIAGVFLATFLTSTLVSWTPGHGLGIEMGSLLLRFIVIVLGDALIVCYLLALLGVCVRMADSTSDGTPDTSQPRTAEIP